MEDKRRLFSIHNKISGLRMGAYPAETAAAALDLIAKAAGYRDHEHACSVVGGADDLAVRAVRELPSDADRPTREAWARALGYESWAEYEADRALERRRA